MEKVAKIVVISICLFFIPMYCYAENDNFQTKSVSTKIMVIVPAKVVFQNEDKVISEEIQVGQKLKEPSHIEIEGYNFDGWYDGEHKWNFEDDVVTDHLTLIAKYKEIEKNAVDVKENFIHTSSNPITGDSIITCVSLMVVSIFCFIVIKIYTKKKSKENKGDN